MYTASIQMYGYYIEMMSPFLHFSMSFSSRFGKNRHLLIARKFQSNKKIKSEKKNVYILMLDSMRRVQYHRSELRRATETITNSGSLTPIFTNVLF